MTGQGHPMVQSPLKIFIIYFGFSGPSFVHLLLSYYCGQPTRAAASLMSPPYCLAALTCAPFPSGSNAPLDFVVRPHLLVKSPYASLEMQINSLARFAGMLQFRHALHCETASP